MSAADSSPGPDALDLRRAFDADSPPTVGLEEEVMLLDPASHDLLPRAPEVVTAAGVPFVKQEMPASQLELLTDPVVSLNQAVAQLYERRTLAARTAAGIGVLCAAGVHPFAAPVGVLTTGPRYDAMSQEFGIIARCQLVCALQVHVAIRPAPAAIAVYNAVRAYLPQLAALAANAPFYAGADTGLASVRPRVAELLPRQGIPPALNSVEHLAGELSWGQRAGAMHDKRQWWWALRLNPDFGTVEVRVPDAQTTADEAAAVAAVVHALCVWLQERYRSNDLPPPVADWRIAENYWSVCRHGLDATLADTETAEQLPARQRLTELLDDLGDTATTLACDTALQRARSMVNGPGSPAVHRQVAAETGLDGLVRWLADRFLEPPTTLHG